MDEVEAIRKIKRRVAGLESVRNSYEPIWKELRDYMLPKHGRFPGEKADDGSRKDSKILDNTAGRALKIMAAGMQSGLTSPARPWFRLAADDSGLMDNQNVKTWLYYCEERMRAVISKIGLYNAFHHTYLELGGFGNGAFGVFEGDYARPLQVRQYTVGEYYTACDSEGNVNSFVRRYQMTASQMIEKFGKENVSSAVSSAYDSDGNSDGKFDVVHVIESNDDRIEIPKLKSFAFRSVYYEPGEAKPLQIGGFYEFPVMAPRWDVVANDVYGNGLGEENLADVKFLMSLRERYCLGLDKANDPPVLNSGRFDLDLLPGGISYDVAVDQVKPAYQVNPPLNEIQATVADTRNAIRSGFFSDLFLMLAQDDKTGRTATEIAERHEEKLTVLGPVLERLHSEMHGPCISRLFAMLMRIGYLPPIPKELAGSNIKVEYISLLDQAQKAVGLTSMQQFTSFVGSLAQVNQSVLDKVDFDEMVDRYADSTGIPPTCIISDEQVAAIRRGRAQAQAQAQQMAALQAGAATAATTAQAAKTASEIPTDNPTLQALLGPMIQR